MASATSNIRHTLSGKCFIKGVLMQMAVRMTLKLKASKFKKTSKVKEKERKQDQQKGISLR